MKKQISYALFSLPYLNSKVFCHKSHKTFTIIILLEGDLALFIQFIICNDQFVNTMAQKVGVHSASVHK